MKTKMIIIRSKPELGFVTVSEESGLLLCGNCRDLLDQDLEMVNPLDTLCPACRFDVVARRALDNYGELKTLSGEPIVNLEDLIDHSPINDADIEATKRLFGSDEKI